MAKRREDESGEALRDDWGGSIYDRAHFTDAELRRAAEVRAAAARGETDWASAHDYVEGIRRRNYGYSGGDDGSAFLPVADGAASGGRYRAQLDALAGELLDAEPFRYDYAADPAWQAYRREYVREGRRAAQDTLGRMAAMTGGMPSTAAVTAAQQAGDYYAAQLSDRLPELYELAYSIHSGGAAERRKLLEALGALAQDDYESRRRDALDARDAEEIAYQRARDALADARYEDETAYKRAQDALRRR